MKEATFVYEDGTRQSGTYYELRKQLEADGWKWDGRGFRKGDAFYIRFETVHEFDKRTKQFSAYVIDMLMKAMASDESLGGGAVSKLMKEIDAIKNDVALAVRHAELLKIEQAEEVEDCDVEEIEPEED